MKLRIRGVGLWTAGIQSWQQLLDGLSDNFRETAAQEKAPSPKSIPSRERRRAPLSVKLALEVCEQACREANLDAQDLPSFFTSAMGDTHITDYLCTALLSESKLLSPTRFHNSVHNAPSGYWTISTGDHSNSGYIGGFLASFPIALWEAAIYAEQNRCSVLLTSMDVAHGAPFTDICAAEHDFAVSLVLSADGPGTVIDIDCVPGRGDWTRPNDGRLRQIAEGNASARSLALLEAAAGNEQRSLSWQIGRGSRLKVTVN